MPYFSYYCIMIYLIRSYGPDNKKAVKIGYAENLSKRFKNYRIHNPYFEVLAIRSGDPRLEMKLQLYFTSYDLKAGFLNEWFLDRPEITTTLFHKPENTINQRLWHKRDSGLFLGSDFTTAGNKRRREIYEELRMIYGVKKAKEIDKAWKIESNKQVLKNIKNREDLLWP